MATDPNYLAYLEQLDPRALQELRARQQLAGTTPGLGQRAAVWGGRLTNGLFGVPKEVASQIDPATIQQARNQALLQMGLGMLAAKQKGTGLGAGMLYGLNQGQDVLGRGLGQAWAAQRAKREDQRFDLQERRYDTMLTRDAEREATRVKERAEDRADTQAWRDDQMRARGTDDARQAEILRLQTEAAARDAEADRRKGLMDQATLKRRRAADLAAKALGQMTPTHPRYAEMVALYESMTGRKWSGAGGLGIGLGGAYGPTSLDDIPID